MVGAQCKLALRFELGLDGKPDYDQALVWWTRAAEQGSDWALKKISLLIEQGVVAGTSDDVRNFAARAKIAGYLTARDQIEASLIKDGSSANAKKVLVVDDEPIVRQVLGMILATEGHLAIEAENGRKALQALSDHPDIAMILVDLSMPIMNGFQFIKTLRNIDAATGVPIIISTGRSTPDYIKEARKLQIQGWITKPFKNDKVLEIIHRFLGVTSSKLAKAQ